LINFATLFKLQSTWFRCEIRISWIKIVAYLNVVQHAEFLRGLPTHRCLISHETTGWRRGRCIRNKFMVQ